MMAIEMPVRRRTVMSSALKAKVAPYHGLRQYLESEPAEVVRECYRPGVRN